MRVSDAKHDHADNLMSLNSSSLSMSYISPTAAMSPCGCDNPLWADKKVKYVIGVVFGEKVEVGLNLECKSRSCKFFLVNNVSAYF